ncbi:MAG TPA: hypothetical protein VHN14_28855 [Kofleriaceae bacterium]|nr:hypothetical protein [Kofleriaceae bacterium]
MLKEIEGNCMKRILKLMLVLSMPHLVYADSELHFSLKSGLNAATLDHEFRANRYGFSGGAAGSLQRLFLGRFLLAGQIEFLYTPRGANVVFDGEKQAEFREYYFDLVTVARPGVQIGSASVYLLLGGEVNFLMSADMENVSGSKQDTTGNLHRIDVALLGGAGVALHLPHQELGPFYLATVFLEARHDVGLIDTDLANGGYKNRSSSLMLGLSFGVGGTPAPDKSPAK